MTFEKILKSMDKYSGKGSFKSWMFTIARNLHIDYHRKSNKLQISALEISNTSNHSENPFIENEQEARFEILSKAIKLLDPEKRELLVMTKLKGMKYREVGKIYNLPEGTIKVRLCRIMKELKESTLEMAKNY
jgi:RNA polymerase sigma-70 factor (ECF subfamily)